MAKFRQLTESEMLKYKKRFMKLNEYSFVNQEEDLLLDEADDEQNDPSQDTKIPNQGENDMNQGMPQDMNQGMPQDMNQGMPQDMNPDVAQMDGQNQNQANPMPLEANPQQDINSPENGGGEVEIDVTDLTKKQDDIDSKISSVSTETASMVDMLTSLTNKLEDIIKKTDSEMAKIKDEIIKRNPTPVEVLQKRITVSDPFTETPSDYWKKKESEGHYKLSDNEDENKIYTIKKSDIDNNATDIYKSFGITDGEFNQSLSSMFRI